MVSVVCKQCQELLCMTCGSTLHRHHDTATIGVVAVELKAAIQVTASTEKKKALLESALEKQNIVAGFRKELFQVETSEIDRVEEHINSLMVALADTRKELFKNLSSIVKKERESLNKTERVLTKIVSSVTSLCDRADELLSSTDDVEVVRRGFVLSEELNEVFVVESAPSPMKGSGFDVSFSPGAIDHATLEQWCGEVMSPFISIVIFCEKPERGV